jgi:D-methionine transport system substrate-binding protein
MKGTAKKALSIALSALLVLTFSFVLTACGKKDNGTIVIGASVAPHAEILRAIEPELNAAGYTLEIIEYTDYVKPNLDTEAGDTYANYFQHVPYLDDFNAENGTNLVSVAAIHFEPLAIYAGTATSLADLPDGAKVAVPNDTTNEARALQLLAAQGLITLPADADLTITPRDIVDNPKNLQFVELEAAAIPPELGEVAIGVINGNFALSAGLDTSTILAAEDANSLAAQTYANVLVVVAGNENTPETKALIAALTSNAARDYINTTYNGAVIPVFKVNTDLFVPALVAGSIIPG